MNYCNSSTPEHSSLLAKTAINCPDLGSIQSGAISAKGTRTNARSTMRGWGSCKVGASMI